MYYQIQLKCISKDCNGNFPFQKVNVLNTFRRIKILSCAMAELVRGLSLQRPRFEPMSVLVGFVVDKMALQWVLL